MPSSRLFDYDSALRARADASDSEKESEAEKLEIIPFERIAAAAERMLSSTENVEKIFQSQAKAFMSLSSGKFNVCPIQTIGQPPLASLVAGKDGQCCIKTGYVTGSEYFVSKIAAGGGDHGGNTGCVLLFSQKTMKLRKILEDEGILTEMRTAAASCLASKLFMPDGVERIGLLGAGIQSIWQLRFLATITPCRRVLLMTRSRQTAEAFQQKMKKSSFPSDTEWQIEIANDKAEFKMCQLIHTVTCSREPVLDVGDVELGRPLHTTAVGSDTAGKQELSMELKEKVGADCFCDSKKQSIERGEFQHYADIDNTPDGPIYLPELGQVLSSHLDAGGKIETGALRKNLKVRSGRGGLTIFDTSGVAVQDAAMAELLEEFL